MTHFDYIIIGGGTAGSVIAARLAEDPTCRVALLEAGPSDEGDPRILEARAWMGLLGSELDWDYVIEPQARGNSTIRHSRGKMLGGCSGHNSCIAFRPPDADLRRWEAQGAAGWGPAEMAHFYEKVRERVFIAEPPGTNSLNEAAVSAAQAVGLPRVAFANNGAFGPGAGIFKLNIKEGIRQSASVAYLHPLAELPNNLTILTGTQVYRIVLDEQNRAIGVDSSRGRIYADREVILCAGAFGSPQLLMLSGIGPAHQLADVGVRVCVDLPGVGANLMDHPEGVIVWESVRPIPEPISQYWEVGVFAHTGVDPADAELPDLMLHFGLMPFTWNTQPLGFPTAQHGFSLTPNVCRARSRGTVRLRTSHPNDVPRIDFQYFTDLEGYDEQVMVEGVKLARRMAAASPLRDWVARELAPGPEILDAAAISEYVRRTANTVYHPAGTCRMGAVDDPAVVVDPQLRVQGVENLRVADASIFPSLTTVNPAITVMMIGEKCAQQTKDDRLFPTFASDCGQCVASETE
ncbi:choline oxidase [bacterium]|nr:choline oxidase [bacterium]